MPSAKKILQEYWGYPDFRPMQAEIIEAAAQGRDVMALLPTGGGKSLCYQVPALMGPGLTLVISPLIALMQDQVAQLNKRGIAATFVNSSQSLKSIDKKLEKAAQGGYKLLYVAPERLQNDLFRARLPRMNIRLLAVDEAHCISQWGYDFRPAYLRISELRDELPDVPLMALTATATDRVRNDILTQLKLSDPAVYVQSFRRDNLSFRVEETDNPAGRITQVAAATEGSGIVYVRTRKRTKLLAQALQRAGVSAAAYHGGMSAQARSQCQQDWIEGKIRVIAATNAFGMGIDKADVRFVLHYNLPSDPESYYQEAGRAGRDGKPSFALCFRNGPDLAELRRWTEEKYPDWEKLKTHYEAICNAFGLAYGAYPEEPRPFDLQQISKQFGIPPLQLYNSLRLLESEGMLHFQDSADEYGWIRMATRPDGLIAYKEANPEWEGLVDFMLRSLGGEAWYEEKRFLPDRWANKLRIERKELDFALSQLRGRDLIYYRPPSDMPVIRFLRPRLRLTQEEVHWSRQLQLKALALERLRALEKFVQVPAGGCRSRMLERYFGEMDSTDCGICDYCLSRRKGTDLSAQIRALLKGGPKLYREVLWSLEPGDTENKKATLRRMIDAGEIELNDFEELSLKA